MYRRMLLLTIGLAAALTGGTQTLICHGNLGENIFEEGDFGRGSDNILQMDPGIAPGFQYVTYVPFDDGKYTITNSTARWPNIYDTWLQIGDHSSDQYGYMMVVNASYAPGIFYQQTVDGLCDNTLYAFTADVINIVRFQTPGHILPNVSFLIDGVERFSSGSIPQDEIWHTYGFTFITEPGQETVTLTLRNNAPGGIGNDLCLDNISFRPCGPASSIEIDQAGRVCENALYPVLSAIIESDTGYVQWQISEDLGITWSDIPGATDRTYQSTQLAANTYYFRYLYGLTLGHLENPKCRIVSAVKELEVVPVHFEIIDTLCAGLSFNLGGKEYNTTGIYHENLTASNGCDSIVTLDLTIVPDPDIHAEIETIDPSCAGTPDGQILVGTIAPGTSPFTVQLLNSASPMPPGLNFIVPGGAYDIMITDRYGCTGIESVLVTDPLPFEINITTASETVILGHPLSVTASGNYPIGEIQWTANGQIVCVHCPTSDVTLLHSGFVMVSAIAETGCTANDSVLITVNEDPRVFAPNVFSPNFDASNDTWEIQVDVLNTPTLARCAIFDRWGNLVYSQSDIALSPVTELWDGMVNGKPAPAAVYGYRLEFTRFNGTTVTKSGSISLVR